MQEYTSNERSDRVERYDSLFGRKKKERKKKNGGREETEGEREEEWKLRDYVAQG